MSDSDKVLTYEEAKQMCMKAFDGGALYGSESMRYGVNATAYDWEHWLKKNESLFKPKPNVEDVLRGVVTLCHNTWKEESAFHFYGVDDVMESGNIADFAAKLRLAGDAE